MFRKDVNVEKLEALENEGMIDMMYHQFTRFQSVTWMARPIQQWERWIRR